MGSAWPSATRIIRQLATNLQQKRRYILGRNNIHLDEDKLHNPMQRNSVLDCRGTKRFAEK